MLTVSENIFLSMSDILEICILQCFGHHLNFRKGFQMLYSVNYGEIEYHVAGGILKALLAAKFLFCVIFRCYLIRFRWLSCQLLRESCSLNLPVVPFVFRFSLYLPKSVLKLVILPKNAD